MSFGYQQQPKSYIGDTVVLDAYLNEVDTDERVSRTELDTVDFTIRHPDDGAVPMILQQPGIIVEDEDGHGQYLAPSLVTTKAGEYKAVARFHRNDGRIESVVVDFEVIDPFQAIDSDALSQVVDTAWMKLEDCFDSEVGNAGPWLRDMTLAKFDQTKMRGLLPEALIGINMWQPVTSYDADSYPYTDGSANAVLAQALLVSTIRHLIRSYTEQPDVMNSNVGYLDRKRYADAWTKVYQLEDAYFQRMLILWKRSMFAFGRPATLVSSKAGRLMPAPMRSRNAGRGYY
jgi:hypothetical protein